ncbi:hypothetical protein CIG75_18985 [Tumebacillus algifaecis]|uniref:Phage protein n=1 Tax=Tumebacillus algifaecis TaxID=1214604 RepID=A0A223D5P4_9BACL|nr:hypothetical protein [Tumebacillus algifaecis]ASS76820.1 hypothetical protein CIG75_18985 [Tumebacillus algifaecis]
MTSNDVRNGVFGALKERFPEVKRYGEAIKQGLNGPCFFVRLLSAQHDRELDRRYKRAHSFDIHYFASSNEDAHAVAEQLYDCLEYIIVADGKCRGTRMRHEVVDGVLHFFVDYDFHVMRPTAPQPQMNHLHQKAALVDG